MNQWDEAARKAVRNINDAGRVEFDAQVWWCEKAYADLRATYEKLVELAAWCIAPVDYDNPEAMNEDYAKFERLKSDPLVQSAIERSKNSAKP